MTTQSDEINATQAQRSGTSKCLKRNAFPWRAASMERCGNRRRGCCCHTSSRSVRAIVRKMCTPVFNGYSTRIPQTCEKEGYFLSKQASSKQERRKKCADGASQIAFEFGRGFRFHNKTQKQPRTTQSGVLPIARAPANCRANQKAIPHPAGTIKSQPGVTQQRRHDTIRGPNTISLDKTWVNPCVDCKNIPQPTPRGREPGC